MSLSNISMFTKNLGLAAFMKMKGCKLLKVENRTFYFNFDKHNLKEKDKQFCNDIKVWEIEYLNSECLEHDTILMSLRKMLK